MYPSNVHYYALKAHYLDASVLVKLVAEDADENPGRTAIREYYASHADMRATSHCFWEALSVFKTKFLRGRISRDDYVRYVERFITQTVGWKLGIDNSPILSLELMGEAEKLIRKYADLDFVDCLQIVTIKHGDNKVFCGDSKSILITADRDLAKVARAEGARVWECTSEPLP